MNRNNDIFSLETLLDTSVTNILIYTAQIISGYKGSRIHLSTLILSIQTLYLWTNFASL